MDGLADVSLSLELALSVTESRQILIAADAMWCEALESRGCQSVNRECGTQGNIWPSCINY